jgi:ribosomal protein S18 acetylase RimI-like enzyme
VDGRVSRHKGSSEKAVIRPAERSDIDALLRIEEAVFASDQLNRRNFRHAVRSPTIACLVAQEEGQVAGYVILERRRSSTAVRLTSIAVAPRAGRRGLGRTLLAAAEEAARRGGARRMRLEVHAGNAAARRLYESSGYHLVETLAEYYDDGGAALRFEKPLAS